MWAPLSYMSTSYRTMSLMSAVVRAIKIFS
jgi:hypothetical protein